DDRPYLLDTGSGILAELPVHWMLDDWEQYAFLPEPNVGAVIESPAKVLDLWTGELDALAAEGGLMILTSHPFLSGQASRVATLRSGGDYVYVSRTLHPALGMMSSWNNTVWWFICGGVPSAFFARYGLGPFLRTVGDMAGSSTMVSWGNTLVGKKGTVIAGAI